MSAALAELPATAELPQNSITADNMAVLGTFDFLTLPPAEIWAQLSPATRFSWCWRARVRAPNKAVHHAWDGLDAQDQRRLRSTIRGMLAFLGMVHLDVRQPA